MKSRRHFLTLVSFLLTLPVSSQNEGLRIRLAGPGSTRCSGRVEIYKNNSWGTICDNKWSHSDAKVVCRRLGCGRTVEASVAARFGRGTGKIWLNNLECLGEERFLSDCKHKEYGENDCSHSKDAGVICELIKLTRGDRCSGKVVIYHQKQWGTVCDNSWDLKDAEVVCRHLNCGTAMAATQGTRFGQPNGKIKIWLDRVACSGSEDSLTECLHSGFGKTDCSHRKDAGVVCSVPLSLLLSSIAGGSLLLLLLVLVVYLGRMRRRGKAKQPGALSLSQLSVTARNKFEDDTNHEYMNFDSGEINKELTEEVGKVADDAYEKPERDDDHLYDVVGPSNLDVKSKEVCASVEENRDDMVEDDENDYVDVTLPF
ncbi:deleted in malignant brain tumors 1 protein isoform X2 [Pleuronectes platessa]|uniref:deleted in malignant brain tumors 1 protein isoform X2 n=1 Tax=Pleuronectes platessa TaxID=8262 RepID=UPI00232A100F|nr:deleted in malignant brain tumors 1 protein isoform X2 [Pleuronectes platessa]